MQSSFAIILGLLAFVHLAVGGPALNRSANEDSKSFALYPGVGYYTAVMTADFNWTQGYEYCIGLGGLLAVPESVAEAEVLKTIISGVSAFYQNIVYVGYHDRFVNGEYETIHDKPLAQSGYSLWASGVPNVSPTLRCGGFSKNGGFINVGCSTTTPAMFICELPLWADYELFEEVGYYKLHLDAKNWTEAWRICRQEDAHLAVINSPEEYAVLQTIFDRHQFIPQAASSAYAWVGVHADYAYNKFRTVVGTTLEQAGYSTWEAGFPGNDYDNEYYTHVALFRNGALSVPHSVYRYAFFCEHEL